MLDHVVIVPALLLFNVDKVECGRGNHGPAQRQHVSDLSSYGDWYGSERCLNHGVLHHDGVVHA